LVATFSSGTPGGGPSDPRHHCRCGIRYRFDIASVSSRRLRLREAASLELFDELLGESNLASQSKSDSLISVYNSLGKKLRTRFAWKYGDPEEHSVRDDDPGGLY